MCISIIGLAQSDSLLIDTVTNSYFEIKSLRHVLDSFFSCGVNCWQKIDLRPKPPKIKTGTVLIKDRLNRPIALYIFVDSLIVQEDHYLNGQLNWQIINNPLDFSGTERYYYADGFLQKLILWRRDEKIIYEYSEDGELIKN